MSKTLRKPNLFIIGAMKSGTTSLHQYINIHPQIAMSLEKEPGYFVEEVMHRRSEAWYLSLFSHDASYRYIGESSTHYTKLPTFPGVAERLYKFNPSARLVYIMRDPFERALSHYWYATRIKSSWDGNGEPRTLLKAITENSQYLAFSDYATQLQPYINRFGCDSIYTLTFEALKKDPQREVDSLFHWLGLSAHSLGMQLNKAHNQKPVDQAVIAGAGILYRIQFSDFWNRLAPHVPAWIKEFARRQAYRPMDPKQFEAEISRLRAIVGELQQRQIERLGIMLGRDFPEWMQG